MDQPNAGFQSDSQPWATGCTNLMASISLLSAAPVKRLLGAGHVAAAIGIPLVAIFGSTNPVTTGPSSQRSCIVRVPVSCSPCLKPECPADHRCMKEITVEMVYAAANAMLAETKEQ